MVRFDMGPMIDCYAASDIRTAAWARAFLDRFLPKRRELASVYDVPYMAEQPSRIFHSADALMNYLESNPEQRHVMYWVSTGEGLVRQAIVAPTIDGAMILGLSCEVDGDTFIATLCHELKEFTGAQDCLADLELPPPASIDDFLELVRSVSDR
ncbi:hypothetical protein [Sorangium sp. So ce388]|uniref:hypothetical protein n=1 Tax=Sorangium sp. So ce388 TaxID=3133309 RepID=UPI003F5B5693